MKQFASPFKVTGTVTSATLSGSPCGALLSYDLTVANNTTTGVATLTTTASPPPGVYTLKVVTDCGCHSMLVYTPPCVISTAGDGSSTHDGDGGTPEPVPSCDDGVVCPRPVIGCFILGDFCPMPEIEDFLLGEACPVPEIDPFVPGATCLAPQIFAYQP